MAVDIFAFTTNNAPVLNNIGGGEQMLAVTGSGNAVFIPISAISGYTGGNLNVTGNLNVSGTSGFTGVMTAGTINATALNGTTITTNVVAAQLQLSGNTILATGTDANVNLVHNTKGASSGHYWSVNSNGALVLTSSVLAPQANNIIDLGTSGERYKDFYFQGKIVPDTRTDTVVGGAVTINKPSGTIDTGTLTTAALTEFKFTLTNSFIRANNKIYFSVAYSGTQVTDGIISGCTHSNQASGTVDISIVNAHPLNALNGNCLIDFWVVG